MTTIQPEQQQCAACGCVININQQSEDIARAEAERNGFNINECVLVCDDCYKMSPWGQRDANLH